MLQFWICLALFGGASGPVQGGMSIEEIVAVAASPPLAPPPQPAPAPPPPTEEPEIPAATSGATAAAITARRAAEEALAALRALRSGALCPACDGSGTVVRRTRVGWRSAGGGLRYPVHANVEGPCSGCDGEGCASPRRLARLVDTAVERINRLPDSTAARARVTLEGQRTIDGLLAAAGPRLARRSEELLKDALARSEEGPVGVLVVQPLRRGGEGASKSRSRDSPGAAPSLEFHGVQVLLRNWPATGGAKDGWIAVLGTLERSAGTAADGAEGPPKVTLTAILSSVRESEAASGRTPIRSATGSGAAGRPASKGR